MTYDSGCYEANMDRAMQIADWNGFEQRRRDAAKRGKLLGRGLANYVESSIGAPHEQARITIRPKGRVDVVIGTQPSGQGHETSFAQVIVRASSCPGREREHHSRRYRRGEGRRRLAFGPIHAPCRHRFLAGRARVDRAGQASCRGHSRHAAEHVEFDDGRFSARGTNRTFDFLELAAEAARHELPGGLGDGSRS